MSSKLEKKFKSIEKRLERNIDIFSISTLKNIKENFLSLLCFSEIKENKSLSKRIREALRVINIRLFLRS